MDTFFIMAIFEQKLAYKLLWLNKTVKSQLDEVPFPISILTHKISDFYQFVNHVFIIFA